MNTPTTPKRKSNLSPPGRVSFTGDKTTVTTPCRKDKGSLPTTAPVVPKSARKSPSTPRTKMILQSSITASPNKLKKVKAPRRSESKLKPPSSLSPTNGMRHKGAPKTPKSPQSIDDRTVKVDNSFTKQRNTVMRTNSTIPSSTLVRTSSVTSGPKSTPRTPIPKVARKSTGSLLASNSFGSTGSKRHSLLSLSLSASSSSEYNAGNEEAVKVCVRIRPVFDISWDQRAYTTGPPEDKSIVRTGIVNTDATVYRFDSVFGEEATTEQVYDTMVKDIVESVCRQGRNGTVFTYGQTSTGKTYTMHGIIAAAAKDIFEFSKADRENSDESSMMTCVKVSCMELYNEELRDLLDMARATSSGLGIKEDRRGNVQVPGLSERAVGSIEELLAVLLEADTNRTVGSTAMNERSSRSHTIFRITYEKKEAREIRSGGAKKGKKGQSFETTDGDDGVECTLSGGLMDEDSENEKITKKMVTTMSTLNLVDLAGSESVRHTGATGDRQKEGGKINQSLLTLSTVLAKLGKKDSGHINYRDSKLTRILKPSLSGNARMSAICCISPMVQFQDESKSTLDFAARTMLVTTNASKNETVEYDDAVVGQFEREMERLKIETANAEKGQQKLAISLQESAEQIVCLMASLEIEKSKVSSLERQNYDFMMQVEELTLLNEELKATEQKKSSTCDKALLKSVEDLKLHSFQLEKRIEQLVEEKSQLEFRLMREIGKAEKRKDAALEKRKRFKNKLGDMKARLREDMTGGTLQHVKVDSR